MKTVEWLNRANGLQTKIKELKEAYWKGVELNKEYHLSALEDYTNRIESLIDNEYQILSEITDVIQGLPDERHRYILFSLYITRKRLSQIAKELNISDTWVQELHKRALTEVKKRLKE